MLLIAFFFVEFSFSQNNAVIDTSNVTYRENLSKFYDIQTSKTEKTINSITDKKVKKQFLLDYSDNKKEFKELIKKGIFIEHKSYSTLIDEILNEIKAANPTFNLDDIKLLIGISEEVNAYNCGDEIIVINMPLLFKSNNKYELAYVIAHEISHQKLNHVYNSMLTRYKKINSEELKNQVNTIDKQKFNKNSSAVNLIKKIIYTTREESRKNEKQADSLGYVLFKNTYPEYNNYAIETLKNLKSIDKERDSLSKLDFEKYFQVNNLKFNNDWLASEISNYNYQKNDKFWNVDSLRTHPDCDERILQLKKNFTIQDKLKNIDNNNFTILKQNADNEFVLGLYFIEEYGKSLYYSLLKLKNKPDEAYLKKMIYENLIKLRDARNDYTLSKYLQTENPKFSESYNQYLCLIRNLRKNELNQIIEFYK